MWSRVIGWYLAVVVALGTTAHLLASRPWARSRGQRGQGMVEYAVIVAVVVLVAMAALQYFGQGVTTVFQHVVARITSIA